MPIRSNKKKKITPQQLPCIKKEVHKNSYTSSSTSNISSSREPTIDVLDCKTLIPPIMHPSALKPPTPNIKISIDQALGVQRKMTPSKHNKLSITRYYHRKLPKLVRNDTFFTIQGYSLPLSMAYMTKFAPRTPKDHKHLVVIRRPLFEDENNAPFPRSSTRPSIKTIPCSKSRLNSNYISRARDCIDKIDKFCENWPWKNKFAISKGLISKPKGKVDNMLSLCPTSPSNIFLRKANDANSLRIVQGHS